MSFEREENFTAMDDGAHIADIYIHGSNKQFYENEQ